MKYLLKTSLLLLLLLPAICKADAGFVIKGKVSGILNGYVSIVGYYPPVKADQESPLPARVRIENGEFTFTGALQHPALVRLKISTREYAVYLENTSYTVDGRLDSLSGADFKGGALNDAYQQYRGSGLSAEAYMKAHPNSEIAAWLALCASDDTYDKALNAYDLLSPIARETWPGRAAAANLAGFKKAAAGTVFPDLQLTDITNKKFTVAQMTGKIVVLDFWASWCGPCRMYIPTMREHYKKYQPLGVQFISVSVDENQQKWKDAMQELQMEWPQVLADGAFQDGKGVKELLHIYYIPHVIVVGKDGKIAASLDSYHKEDLTKTLDSLLQ